MAKISVSEAARMAGISRSYLYRRYIKTGEISVEKDNPKIPTVDTAEILRVFGKLQGDSELVTENRHSYTPENDSKIAVLEAKLQLISEQLTAAQDDKKWLQGKVDQLTDHLRLLEHKPAEPQEKRGWFSRLFRSE